MSLTISKNSKVYLSIGILPLQQQRRLVKDCDNGCIQGWSTHEARWGNHLRRQDPQEQQIWPQRNASSAAATTATVGAWAMACSLEAGYSASLTTLSTPSWSLPTLLPNVDFHLPFLPLLVVCLRCQYVLGQTWLYLLMQELEDQVSQLN